MFGLVHSDVLVLRSYRRPERRRLIRDSPTSMLPPTLLAYAGPHYVSSCLQSQGLAGSEHPGRVSPIRVANTANEATTLNPEGMQSNTTTQPRITTSSTYIYAYALYISLMALLSITHTHHSIRYEGATPTYRNYSVSPLHPMLTHDTALASPSLSKARDQMKRQRHARGRCPLRAIYQAQSTP